MTYDKNNIEFAPLPAHPRFVNLTGQTFRSLTVIGYAPTHKSRTMWFCECQCGRIVAVRAERLCNGRAASCGGCLRESFPDKELFCQQDRPISTIYEYEAYQRAKSRCNCTTKDCYPDYGGRGIEFRFDSFKQFYAELGTRPSPKHSLERINNNGHYEPGNVKWATKTEQQRNRRTNHLVSFNGATKALAEWCDVLGIVSAKVADGRLGLQWCAECALTLPLYGKCVHKLS